MSLLKELAGHPEYQRLVTIAKQTRPELPPWNPSDPTTENDWKHISGMQQGFDLCLQIFMPK